MRISGEFAGLKKHWEHLYCGNASVTTILPISVMLFSIRISFLRYTWRQRHLKSLFSIWAHRSRTGSLYVTTVGHHWSWNSHSGKSEGIGGKAERTIEILNNWCSATTYVLHCNYIQKYRQRERFSQDLSQGFAFPIFPLCRTEQRILQVAWRSLFVHVASKADVPCHGR